MEIQYKYDTPPVPRGTLPGDAVTIPITIWPEGVDADAQPGTTIQFPAKWAWDDDDEVYTVDVFEEDIDEFLKLHG